MSKTSYVKLIFEVHRMRERYADIIFIEADDTLVSLFQDLEQIYADAYDNGNEYYYKVDCLVSTDYSHTAFKQMCDLISVNDFVDANAFRKAQVNIPMLKTYTKTEHDIKIFKKFRSLEWIKK
jgi:hypothetical protein